MYTDIENWANAGSVGVIFIHRAPDGHYDTWVERVVKLREMPNHLQASCEMLLDHFDALSAEVLRNKDGKVDRIKLMTKPEFNDEAPE